MQSLVSTHLLVIALALQSVAKWDEPYVTVYVRLEKKSMLDPRVNRMRTDTLMKAGVRSRHAKDAGQDEDWEDGTSV